MIWSCLLGLLACGTACTQGANVSCVHGASVACSCVDGNHGAQVCNAEGTFDPCQCAPDDGGVLPDASTSDAGVRTVLHADATCYSNITTGLASNDGLSPSTPKPNPQACADLITTSWDLAGFTATIQNAAGQTDNYGVIFEPGVGGGNLVLDMQGGTISTVGSLSGFTGGNFHAMGPIGTTAGAFSATMIVTNTYVTMTGTWGCAVTVNGEGVIVIGAGVTFGPAISAHLCTAAAGAQLGIVSPYTIAGGAQFHYFADNNSTIYSSDAPLTVTLKGTPAFSDGFAGAMQGASLLLPAVTYSGAASGPRYFAAQGGTIFTGSNGSPTYFPGSAPGSAQASWEYN